MTREEAKDYLNAIWFRNDIRGAEALAIKMAIEALEQEQNTKWIPVNERLPKHDEDVLVYHQNGRMEVAYYHIDDTYYPAEYVDLNETGWYNENDDVNYDVLYDDPIAWMPLPEPYKMSEIPTGSEEEQNENSN